MHIIATVIATLVATVVSDNCAAEAENAGGNWYCSPVKAIQYTNVGSAGSYRQVTNMAADGTCSSTPKAFVGPLAPLDEEVSLHFRGPLALKQFAAYNLSGLGKRGLSDRSVRRHGRRHQHKRDAEPEVVEDVHPKRRDMVTATIDGQVVSWENNYFGPPPSTPAFPAAQPPPTPPSAPPPSPPPPPTTPPSPSAPIPLARTTTVAPTSSSHNNPSSSDSGDYIRIGYYDSASQHLDGLTFLGNHGGAGSGVFDYIYGASLSYLSADGLTGASSAQTLKDTTIPSGSEFTIMTNRVCSDGDCGYTRPGSVAYHGFDGADEMFLFEFIMPLDGNRGFNGDMPAIWMLNAQVPRTLQYGNAACSCWISGCGEFDIAEVLSPGSMRCKSTIHTNAPVGDPDYIMRPTTRPMKLAVVFSSAASSVHIQVLPDDARFDERLTAGKVTDWCKSTAGSLLSTFAIAPPLL